VSEVGARVADFGSAEALLPAIKHEEGAGSRPLSLSCRPSQDCSGEEATPRVLSPLADVFRTLHPDRYVLFQAPFPRFLLHAGLQYAAACHIAACMWWTVPGVSSTGALTLCQAALFLMPHLACLCGRWCVLGVHRRREAYTCWSQATGAEEFNFGCRIDLFLVSGPCQCARNAVRADARGQGRPHRSRG